MFWSSALVVWLCQALDIPGGAKDHDIISTHIGTMHAEMAKSVPIAAVLEDRMARMLAARRQAVINKPLQELLEEYPALTRDDQVRVCMVCYVTVCASQTVCYPHMPIGMLEIYCLLFVSLSA